MCLNDQQGEFMIVFLEKVRVKTVFSAFEPVMVEPLELCVIKSVLNSMNVENYVKDELFGLDYPKGKIPHIVILTGYNVAEKKMVEASKKYKTSYPNVKIIVGGVHVQKNREVFHVDSIDYVFHSQSMDTLKILIEKIIIDDFENMTSGIDYKIKSNSDQIIWRMGETESLHHHEKYAADRSIFYEIKNKTRYLEKRNVAIVKGSIGCPYNCQYCYCKILNNNYYLKADFSKILDETKDINADYFWIVDDVLFTNRKEAEQFIHAVKNKNLTIKIIAYLRADFILREQDLLKSLKEAGISEVIVGFEATNNKELNDYEKTTDALNYPQVIRLLKENNIDLTALFMVHPDYKLEDFINLHQFIKQNKIDVFTISIFTPIKGTTVYEKLKDKLISHNPEKYDFMHLVLKPKLPKWIFYILFYGIHLNMLKSKRVWKYLTT